MSTPGEVEHATHEHHEPKGFWSKYVFSVDHKVIGKQFLFSSMLWALVGGSLAIMVRQQIAWPGEPYPVIGCAEATAGAASRQPMAMMNASVRFSTVPLLCSALGRSNGRRPAGRRQGSSDRL